MVMCLDELLVKMRYKLEQIGIDINQEDLECFQIYYRMLKEENKKINITSIIKEEEIIIKHFIDSISCLKAISINPGMKLLDVGTGAGFPGIPLKICRPETNIILVESQLKKVIFLNKVIKEMDLKNITVIHGRAEEIGRNPCYRENCDCVTGRAVAKLAVLAEYCLPLVKVGGIFLAMKGPKIKQELLMADKAIRMLGGEVSRIIDLKLPVTHDQRNLVVIKKLRTTPDKYPRRTGVPQKRPI